MLLWVLGCGSLEQMEQDFPFEGAYQTWCDTERNVDVVDVYDGDTITLSTAEKIRFLGAAAPEVSPPECYGDVSADFLRELILDQEVRLQFDVECEDIYQRTLSWVFLDGSDAVVASLMEEYSISGLQSDGSYNLLVNEMLIRMGYAKIFRGDVAENIRYTDLLESAEAEAKEDGLGLWGACE